MKTLLNFINESSNIDIKNILDRYKESNDLDANNQEDMDKLNILAMDALDLYWNKKGDNWDKKVNDDLYNLYKQSFNLLLNKKNEEAKKSYINVISQALKQFKTN